MDPKTVSHIINETGEEREEYFNAVTPPIFQTSNFSFKTVDNLRKAFADESASFMYSRATNPTLKILSEKMAALDGAEDCLVFNSGSGTIFAAVLANVKSGDHIVSVANPYSWAKKMFDNVLPRFNVSTTYVDGRNIEDFEKAIQPNTSIIYLETPNSWSFYLQDLEAVAGLARSKNQAGRQTKIITICDNSYCTPLYQRPIDMGIDLVLQSATKYINGHSDVVAGVLCGRKGMIEKIFNSEYMNMGIGTTPFNAWLLIRGLRTLPTRLERVSVTTGKVVNYLKSKKEIEEISYPFDKEFPQYELAKKQMSGAGGLFSFILKAKTIREIENFCDSLRHILMAVSWGGHESLIIPGCASVNAEDFDPENKIHRRLRMYVGLEDADYIIEDLERGFQGMTV
ncbi:MAG: PLP-dependent aspartate aminotransferase family protein [Ginsengibacter sp.]